MSVIGPLQTLPRPPVAPGLGRKTDRNAIGRWQPLMTLSRSMLGVWA